MAFDRVVVGLGNPGPKYDGTRHNIGFEVVRSLAGQHGVILAKKRHDCLCGEGRVHGERALLALPESYMNRSGQPVKKLLDFTGTPVTALVVVHDDLDLPCGKVRIRCGGGAGGHNGIRSLMDHLHTRDFVRVKIGIGRPPEGIPAERYVLQSFSLRERRAVADGVARALDAFEVLVREGAAKAMSLFNRDPDD